MNSAQNKQKIAKTIANQMADELPELLKSAREQLTGENLSENYQAPQESKQNNAQVSQQEQARKNIQVERRMEAFNRELSDISREKLFSELQQKISQGQEVPISDFTELSMEQKQVLKAQAEAVKIQIQNQQAANRDSLNMPSSKKGRRLMGFGQKAAADKQTTRVEKPVPPSG